MRFQVLGPLEVHVNNGPITLGGPKQRAVLLHLILRANHTVPAPTLIDELWGDEPPESARNTLQTYVSHLRKALGAERIEGRPPGYRLEVGPDEARRRLGSRRCSATHARPARPTRRRQSRSWSRRSVCGAVPRSPTSPTNPRWRVRRRGSMSSGSWPRRTGSRPCWPAANMHGRSASAEALLGHHPLRERVWGQLMIALYRSGRQGDAL